MAKYTIQELPYLQLRQTGELASAPVDTGRQVNLYKEGQLIATFHGDNWNNRTNAQKVCDLLNEASRSQGKY